MEMSFPPQSTPPPRLSRPVRLASVSSPPPPRTFQEPISTFRILSFEQLYRYKSWVSEWMTEIRLGAPYPLPSHQTHPTALLSDEQVDTQAPICSAFLFVQLRDFGALYDCLYIFLPAAPPQTRAWTGPSFSPPHFPYWGDQVPQATGVQLSFFGHLILALFSIAFPRTRLCSLPILSTTSGYREIRGKTCGSFAAICTNRSNSSNYSSTIILYIDTTPGFARATLPTLSMNSGFMAIGRTALLMSGNLQYILEWNPSLMPNGGFL
jgi:hypothetical protein